MKFAAALALAVISLAFLQGCTSDNGIVRVGIAVNQLCISLKGILPVASMLMVLVGASVYAAGQLMGAETRARANVWATAALMGALVGLLINSIAPPILSPIYGSTVSCSPSGSS